MLIVVVRRLRVNRNIIQNFKSEISIADKSKQRLLCLNVVDTKAWFSQVLINTVRKMSKSGSFSSPYFTVFSPNTGKYGPGKNSYLDTFHTVKFVIKPYRMEKKYSSRRFLSGFSDKEWTPIETDKLSWNSDSTGSAGRITGNGQPK